jgi:hypothetical protein
MGGSGGSFGSGYNPRDIAKEVRETEKRVQGEALNAELAGLLTELLGEINNRDTGLVEQRLEKIVEELAGIANGKLARIMHHAARFCTSAAEARATAPAD